MNFSIKLFCVSMDLNFKYESMTQEIPLDNQFFLSLITWPRMSIFTRIFKAAIRVNITLFDPNTLMQRFMQRYDIEFDVCPVKAALATCLCYKIYCPALSPSYAASYCNVYILYYNYVADVKV